MQAQYILRRHGHRDFENDLFLCGDLLARVISGNPHHSQHIGINLGGVGAERQVHVSNILDLAGVAGDGEYRALALRSNAMSRVGIPMHAQPLIVLKAAIGASIDVLGLKFVTPIFETPHKLDDSVSEKGRSDQVIFIGDVLSEKSLLEEFETADCIGDVMGDEPQFAKQDRLRERQFRSAKRCLRVSFIGMGHENGTSDEVSDDEAARRRDEVIKRMLETPPQPHKTKKGRTDEPASPRKRDR